MNGDPVSNRLIARLRVRVAELRQLEREGAEAGELEARRVIITPLQSDLADVVRDLLHREEARHSRGVRGFSIEARQTV
jgi:hypothetical protein